MVSWSLTSNKEAAVNDAPTDWSSALADVCAPPPALKEELAAARRVLAPPARILLAMLDTTNCAGLTDTPMTTR